MKVMSLHTFEDNDVEFVLFSGDNRREIVLNRDNEGSLIISRNDVIALAKEFNLVVYDVNSKLKPVKPNQHQQQGEI